MDVRLPDPEPAEPPGHGPQEKTCSSICLEWLHLLRSWSLRQSRRGLDRDCCNACSDIILSGRRPAINCNTRSGDGIGCGHVFGLGTPMRRQPIDAGSGEVPHDAGDCCRFFYAGPHAGFLFSCVERMIDQDVPREPDFFVVTIWPFSAS